MEIDQTLTARQQRTNARIDAFLRRERREKWKAAGWYLAGAALMVVLLWLLVHVWWGKLIVIALAALAKPMLVVARHLEKRGKKAS